MHSSTSPRVYTKVLKLQKKVTRKCGTSHQVYAVPTLEIRRHYYSSLPTGEITSSTATYYCIVILQRHMKPQRYRQQRFPIFIVKTFYEATPKPSYWGGATLPRPHLPTPNPSNLPPTSELLALPLYITRCSIQTTVYYTESQTYKHTHTHTNTHARTHDVQVYSETFKSNKDATSDGDQIDDDDDDELLATHLSMIQSIHTTHAPPVTSASSHYTATL